MLGGFRSWIRRRLQRNADDAEDDLDDDDDEERDHGALVRKGEQVTLRQQVPQNREAFQRWYADPEIANLLRHDLEPLTDWQSRGYFDSFILRPLPVAPASPFMHAKASVCWVLRLSPTAPALAIRTRHSSGS
jgi:hypothetical protein